MPSECSICLDPFDDAHKRSMALSCGHIHCNACLVTWFKSHATCPTCNYSFVGASQLLAHLPEDLAAAIRDRPGGLGLLKKKVVAVTRIYLPTDSSKEKEEELSRKIRALEEERQLMRNTINKLMSKLYQDPDAIEEWIRDPAPSSSYSAVDTSSPFDSNANKDNGKNTELPGASKSPTTSGLNGFAFAKYAGNGPLPYGGTLPYKFNFQRPAITANEARTTGFVTSGSSCDKQRGASSFQSIESGSSASFSSGSSTSLDTYKSQPVKFTFGKTPPLQSPFPPSVSHAFNRSPTMPRFTFKQKPSTLGKNPIRAPVPRSTPRRCICGSVRTAGTPSSAPAQEELRPTGAKVDTAWMSLWGTFVASNLTSVDAFLPLTVLLVAFSLGRLVACA